VCIQNFPTYMALDDIICFIAPTSSGVIHIRLLRSKEEKDTQMAAVEFDGVAAAQHFVQERNQQPFSSLNADDVCHALLVDKVIVNKAGEALFKPSVQQLELPTCPVCLERLDRSISGLPMLTVLCRHTFHSECLQQWLRPDSKCPVCRASLNGIEVLVAFTPALQTIPNLTVRRRTPDASASPAAPPPTYGCASSVATQVVGDTSRPMPESTTRQQAIHIRWRLRPRGSGITLGMAMCTA
jgi:hypothetical protein